MLIIVWDHRKREPAEIGEYEIFWPTRKYKSLATVVWLWIGTWIINDNIIQHTDFYYSIKKLLWNWNVQLDKTYNDIFSSYANRNRWIIKNKFVFQEWNSYNLWNLDALKSFNKDAYTYFLSMKKFQLSKGIISTNL